MTVRSLPQRINRARPYIALVGFALAVVMFAVSLPAHANRGSWSTLAQVGAQQWYTLAILLVVTFCTRGRTLYHVANTFLSGYFLSIGVAFLVLERTRDAIGVDQTWQRAVLVPLVEELAKALPLLLVYLVFRRRTDFRPTVSDFVVLGFASGAGFAFHEDALWARSIGSGWALNWGALFPGSYRGEFFAIGQAGWTALVGLGLGIALARRGRRLSWLAALAAYTVVVADHAMVNDHGRAYHDARGVLLGGHLLPILLVVGLAIAVFHELRVLKSSRGAPVVPLFVGTALQSLRGTPVASRRVRWKRALLMIRATVLRVWRLHGAAREVGLHLQRTPAPSQATMPP